MRHRDGLQADPAAGRQQPVERREVSRPVRLADGLDHLHAEDDVPAGADFQHGAAGVMGPILRSPQQGADTVVWLATADPGRLGSGQFWHDRRPRSEYLLPWTRDSSPAIAGQLWERIAGRRAWMILSHWAARRRPPSSSPAREQLTRP